MMMQRVFGRAVKDAPEFETLKKVWAGQFQPMLSRQLEAYDSYGLFIPARVILSFDVRAVECVLARPEGTFLLVTLRLSESPTGEVRIENLQFAFSNLDVAGALRHTMLLLRVPLPGIIDPEEIEVAHLGTAHGLKTSLAFKAINAGDLKTGAQLWLNLPDEVRATRIWKDVRNRLAFQGSAVALDQLEAEARAGAGGTPFTRFALAVKTKDSARSLAAIDDVLVAHQRLAWFQVVKTGLLVEAGRTEEALALSRDLCDLLPASPSAYSAAFHAAVAAEKSAAALEALQRWSKVSRAEEVDKAVGAMPVPSIAAFRKSAAYESWRNQALADSKLPAKKAEGVSDSPVAR
jgi:hypothetical protein